MILAIYVDDGILIGRDISKINKLIRNLEKEFEIKIERNPKTFRRMEMERTETGLKLSQPSFAKHITKVWYGKCKDSRYSDDKTR